MEAAKPALLEPVMNVEVQAPVEFAGDLMGDMNGRRGRISGMDTKGGTQIIKAQVPDGGDAQLSERPDLHDPGPRLISRWSSITTITSPACRPRKSSPPPKPPEDR